MVVAMCYLETVDGADDIGQRRAAGCIQWLPAIVWPLNFNGPFAATNLKESFFASVPGVTT